MAFKFFTIPIRDAGAAEAELNAFLRSHRVLVVERRWVDQGQDSFWSFCVDYLDGPYETPRDQSKKRGKDYRDELSPDDFAVFAKLRELRKEIGQTEGVPVYTIFTNEQLAQMVQKQVRAKSDLEKITGIGEARIDKYGARFLDLLNGQVKETEQDTDETGGKPV